MYNFILFVHSVFTADILLTYIVFCHFRLRGSVDEKSPEQYKFL